MNNSSRRVSMEGLFKPKNPEVEAEEQEEEQTIDQQSSTRKQISVNEKQAKSLVNVLAISVGKRQKEHIQQINQCLKNVKFFQEYSESEHYNEVIQNLELETKNADSILFRENDVADKFFIILQGRIGLYIATSISQPSLSSEPQDINTPRGNTSTRNKDDTHQTKRTSNSITSHESSSQQSQSAALRNFGVGVKEIAQLDAGDAFGELGLLYNQERTATAICLEQTSLLVLKKDIFDKYLSQKKNTKISSIIDFYTSIWMLRSLSEIEIRSLSTKTVLNQCPKNTIIIRQGEKPKGIYFVKKGFVKMVMSIKLTVDNNNSSGQFVKNDKTEAYKSSDIISSKQQSQKIIDVQIDEIGNGSIFADYEAYNNREMELTAVAGTSCEILTINISDFQSCVPEYVFQAFTKQVKHYPNEEKVKKQYLDNITWNTYKNDVIHKFNNELINSVRTQRMAEHRMPFMPKVSLEKYAFSEDQNDMRKDQNNGGKEQRNKSDFNLFDFDDGDNDGEGGEDSHQQQYSRESDDRASNEQYSFHNNNDGGVGQKEKLSQDVMRKPSTVANVFWKSPRGSGFNQRIQQIANENIMVKKGSSTSLHLANSQQRNQNEMNQKLHLELNALLSKGFDTSNKKEKEKEKKKQTLLARPTSLAVLNRQQNQSQKELPTSMYDMLESKLNIKLGRPSLILKGSESIRSQQQLQISTNNVGGKSKELQQQQQSSSVAVAGSILKLPLLPKQQQQQSLKTLKQIHPIIKQSAKTARLYMEIY